MSGSGSTSTNGNASVPPTENEISFSLLNSEKALQEIIQQPLLHGTDDHLIEFSEALRNVAKALRRVTEGKASAEAESAEWKRKYELERARNMLLEQKVLSPVADCSELNVEKGRNLEEQTMPSDENRKQCDLCCEKDGICAHQVLRNGGPDINSSAAKDKMMRKASFKLSWYCKGEQGDGHKHDIVSFEKGNITTVERSSKLISLKWESPPHTVLIITKPNSTLVRNLCLKMVRWLKEHKNLSIFVAPQVKAELLTESFDYSFVQTWLDGPGKKGGGKSNEDMQLLHTKIDLVVTLGGDGTVLWAASMFKGPVPPIVPFSLGSLGFMTTFHSEHYREDLTSILLGPISITLRHRLQCHIIRSAANSEHENEGPVLVLNEVTIDRGTSSFLTNLECFCDDSFVTRVQGDGLILSTTSGSTAYSLAAGGSMVHPQVPGILFTPICPHSLSFRPLILPEHVTIRVLVPLSSRSNGWVSFDGKGRDGKDREQLRPGDALVCSMSPWPVPTACQADPTTDFLRSINDGLHWNMRKTQSSDGPRDT